LPGTKLPIGGKFFPLFVLLTQRAGCRQMTMIADQQGGQSINSE